MDEESLELSTIEDRHDSKYQRTTKYQKKCHKYPTKNFRCYSPERVFIGQILKNYINKLEYKYENLAVNKYIPIKIQISKGHIPY